MVKIIIDGKTLEVEENTTVFHAAKQAGIPIPHLCYHPAFAPEGSCRMCLVEIEGLPKLELACSTLIKDGMKISTQSDRVVVARKGVLEFLLAEHPLDCPICDKAGDCKLQDYYEKYGLFDSEYRETKEKGEKKNKIGKSLILDQERCVLCRRCDRFLKEITKTQELGVFERGIHSVINIYDALPVNNNYSGNLAEICPVGAITDLDFRFKTRTWFLKQADSICPLCSRGCNIIMEYHRGFSRFAVPKRVYRIKSRQNHDVNGFWICDYGRYGYSYIDTARLDHIICNNGNKKHLMRGNNLLYLAEKIKKLHISGRTARIMIILNSWLLNEELFLIKKLFKEDLQVKKIYFVDPLHGEKDSFLLTEERSPNRRGAKELGFGINPFDLKALEDKTDVLLIFGSYLLNHYTLTDIKADLDKIEMKILFSSYTGELNTVADITMPVPVIPEKEGSLTNLDGIVQKLSPAFEAPGDCQPEWKVLVNLAKLIGINFNYYSQFSSLDNIFQEMEKTLTFFGKQSD